MGRSPRRLTFLVIDLMDAVLKDYSVAEIEWQRGARWTPTRFTWRDPRHFALDKEDGMTLRLRTELEPRDGEELPAFKFITHTPRLFSGPVATAGLVRPLSVRYSVTVKTLGVGAWLAYMEIFGVPARLGKYPEGVSEDDIEALEKAVQMIGLDGAGVMPATTRIELLDAIGRGNGTGEREVVLSLHTSSRSTSEAERRGISTVAPGGDPDPGWDNNPGSRRGATQ